MKIAHVGGAIFALEVQDGRAARARKARAAEVESAAARTLDLFSSAAMNAGFRLVPSDPVAAKRKASK